MHIFQLTVDMMNEIMERLERKEIKVNIMKSFSLEKTFDAFSFAEILRVGKVVILIP